VGGEFEHPDWSAPLDVAARVRAAPADATVKGMFFDGPIREAYRRTGERPGQGRYVPFKDYPLTHHVQVLAACAMSAYPGLPVREGLRRLGRDAFTTFLESLSGRIVLSMAGRGYDAALDLVARSYRIAGPVGTATVTERTPEAAVVRLHDIFNFPDCYHVGIFEAAMEHFGKRGQVLLRVRSPSDVDLKLAVR
jgi:uncharacterized protein (TIGR02265 family)